MFAFAQADTQVTTVRPLKAVQPAPTDSLVRMAEPQQDSSDFADVSVPRDGPELIVNHILSAPQDQMDRDVLMEELSSATLEDANASAQSTIVELTVKQQLPAKSAPTAKSV